MKLGIVRIIVLAINLVHIPICILAAVVDVVIICALVPGLLWARILNINASIKINITCLINILPKYVKVYSYCFTIYFYASSLSEKRPDYYQ